jgi:RES domain-containing protein
LATLEIMVHLQDYSILCNDYSFVPIEFPPDLVTLLDIKTFPDGWDSASPGAASQQLGDIWAAELRSPILAVPTVLVPEELNYILNPQHPDFVKIVLGKAQKL